MENKHMTEKKSCSKFFVSIKFFFSHKNELLILNLPFRIIILNSKQNILFWNTSRGSGITFFNFV